MQTALENVQLRWLLVPCFTPVLKNIVASKNARNYYKQTKAVDPATIMDELETSILIERINAQVKAKKQDVLTATHKISHTRDSNVTSKISPVT